MMNIVVRVAFRGAHHADNIKTRNRINCCSFFFALLGKFARRTVLDYFFVKWLFLLQKLVQ
ncbi:hypothetical protein FOA39_09620 [Streptococcus cristatus]|nr:hypothetical protein [Streptococcus cristatus]